MDDQMLRKMKYNGDTIIGEKGQVVIPVELRKQLGIETGDRFLVMGSTRMGAWGFVLVKADVLSQLVQEIFGGKLEEVLGQEGREDHHTETANERH
ncbi:MAG: AbrB/MazE/SpoVT family DNA-binding domain-containing protein [Halobacteriota archaeon]